MRLSFHFPSAAAVKQASLTAICAALITSGSLAGCGGSGDTNSSEAGSNSGGSSGSGQGGGLFGGSSGTGPGITIPPDSSFTSADIGAYALGDEIDGKGSNTGVVNSDDGCDTLIGVVRDFKGADEQGGHPDFQSYSGDAETRGLVNDDLGTDRKPIYGSECETDMQSGNCPYGRQTTDVKSFNQWYRFIEGTNRAFIIFFKFETNGGISTFESTRFFPLDNEGWGNSGDDEDNAPRNFHFTTELHTSFKYQGGETFRFSGDDDLWVFINGKLGLDLGGLHPAVTDEIDLDQRAGELGIEKGNIYSLELFHAERHTSASNFRVDTNLAFVDCGTVLPDPK
jgi:fibro-slime domain-containing protein